MILGDVSAGDQLRLDAESAHPCGSLSARRGVARHAKIHLSAFDGLTVGADGLDEPVEFVAVSAPGRIEHVLARHEAESEDGVGSGLVRCIGGGDRQYKQKRHEHEGPMDRMPPCRVGLVVDFHAV